MLSTRLSPHLSKLVNQCPAISRQFVYSQLEEKDAENMADPLLEEDHTLVRGLVHKYGNRALILLTMNCAAYCRFCTRRRKVSDVKKGVVTEKDIDAMSSYIKKHPEITELIFSGGDPLTVPLLLKKAIKKLLCLSQIKVVRVGTRLHVSNPAMINKQVIEALRMVKGKPLYIMVHFEHPAEITKSTIGAIKRLQAVSTMLLSQSVSLKGINDSVEIWQKLCTDLIGIGVKPYYIFRCDPVRGAKHFIVDFKKEIDIMTKLRTRLSGIACPLYVIDAPGGSGKIPGPLSFWKFDLNKYKDFKGNLFSPV